MTRSFKSDRSKWVIRYEEIGLANHSMRQGEILGAYSQQQHLKATECHVKIIKNIESEVKRSKN